MQQTSTQESAVKARTIAQPIQAAARDGLQSRGQLREAAA